MSREIFDTPYWQTNETAVAIAGLYRVSGDIGKERFGEDTTKDGFREESTHYNNRKTSLLDMGVVNWLGRGSTAGHIDIDKSEHSIEILGHEIGEINDVLAENGLGDITLINTNSFDRVDKNGNARVPNDLQAEWINDGLNIINPGPVQDLAYGKFLFDRVVRNHLNRPPTQLSAKYAIDGTDLADSGIEFGIEEFPSDKRDARNRFLRDWGALAEVDSDYNPIVYKPLNGYGGNGVEFLRAEEYLDRVVEQELEPGLLELRLPHFSDIRAIGGGGTVSTAYERIGKHSVPQTNLDALPDKVKYSPQQLIDGKHATPINVDADEDELEGLLNLVENGNKAVEAYLEQQGVEELANAGVHLGWDAMVIDHQHPLFEEYPQTVQEHFMDDQYKIDANVIRGYLVEEEISGREIEADSFYLVPAEANFSPGVKGDSVNRDYPHQNSALNLRHYGDCLSEGKEFQRGGFMF